MLLIQFHKGFELPIIETESVSNRSNMICQPQPLKMEIKMKVHLFKVMILALSASPATPVAVFVVGKVIEGLL